MRTKEDREKFKLERSKAYLRIVSQRARVRQFLKRKGFISFFFQKPTIIEKYLYWFTSDFSIAVDIDNAEYLVRCFKAGKKLYVLGWNPLPPYHINCRCFTEPMFKEKI